MIYRLIVSYDLDAPGQNYVKLIAELTRLGFVRGMYSFWVGTSNLDSLQMRDHLCKFIDGNDRLFVGDVGSGWAGWNIENSDTVQRKIA